MRAFGDWIPYKFFKRGEGAGKSFETFATIPLTPVSSLGSVRSRQTRQHSPDCARVGGKKQRHLTKEPTTSNATQMQKAQPKPKLRYVFLNSAFFYFCPPTPPPVRTRDIPRTLSSLAASRQLPRMLGHCL